MNKKKAISLLVKMGALEPLDMAFKYIQCKGSPPLRIYARETQQVLHPALLVGRNNVDHYEERAVFDVEDDEILVVSFAPIAFCGPPMNEEEKINPSFAPNERKDVSVGHCIFLFDWKEISGIANASSNMQTFIDMIRS